MRIMMRVIAKAMMRVMA